MCVREKERVCVRERRFLPCVRVVVVVDPMLPASRCEVGVMV